MRKSNVDKAKVALRKVVEMAERVKEYIAMAEALGANDIANGLEIELEALNEIIWALKEIY